MIVGLTPSGGNDDTQIQNAVNQICATGGGTLVLEDGTWHRAATVSIPSSPISIVGRGRSTLQIPAAPGLTLFDYAAAGARGIEFKDMAFATSVGGKAIRLVSTGGAADPATYLYEVRGTNLDFEGNWEYCIEHRTSMGARFNGITMRGGQNGLYLWDTGEVSVGDMVAENMTGLTLILDGTGNANDHMAEGPILSRVTMNGCAYGLFLRNVGFVEASDLEITSSGLAAVLFRGTVRDVTLSGVFGANANNSAIVFDPASDGQPQGRFQRIRLTGQIYESAFGIVANKVDGLSVHDMQFTVQKQADIFMIDARNARITGCLMDSVTQSGRNVIEVAPSDYNHFDGNTVRYAMSLSGAHSTETNTTLLAPGT